MRCASIVLACWAAMVALAATASTAAERTFPYTAYVNSRDVYVRSGPGRDYYPTEKVQAGVKVEVYRHDPGGWYAIRPTKESYSWVSSRYLEPTTDGLGRITREKVSSRVGSLLSNVRDVIQVRLNQDELVEIRDEVNTGGQTWYKISPPAGEFRWISGRYVDRKKPHDGVSQPRHRRASKNQSRGSSRTQIAQSEDQTVDADQRLVNAEVPDDKASSDPADDDARSSNRHVELATWEKDEDDLPDDGSGETPDAETADSEAVTYATAKSSAEGDGAKPSSDVRPAVYWEGERGEDRETSVQVPTDDEPRHRKTHQRKIQSPAEFKAALQQIDVELSEMVVEEPTVWHFEDMNRRLGMLLEDAATALERGRVRQVLSKIAKFEDIQARFAKVNRVQSATDRANQRLDAGRPTQQRDDRVQRAAAWEKLGRDYDGVGYLRPVVSRRPNAPRYALVDERGDVLTFITPAPGLHLQSSVGRRIGVTGTRGFIPDYNRPHVMVQRIADLGAGPASMRR